jgi:phosphatidylglycerol phospholipase C
LIGVPNSAQVKYVKICLDLLPGFPLAYIGWSLAYARALLEVPNMNFNMLQYSVAGPCGKRFMKDARKKGRAVFVWTVNDEEWMEWSIRKELDGVITDDPKLFLEVCDRWGRESVESKLPESGRPRSRRVKHMAIMLLFQVASVIAAVIMFILNGFPKRHVRKVLRG